jgi:hypothetical protein
MFPPNPFDDLPLLVRTARERIEAQTREFGDFMDRGRGILRQRLDNPFTDTTLEITVIKVGDYTSFTLIDRYNNTRQRYRNERDALDAVNVFINTRIGLFE